MENKKINFRLLIAFAFLIAIAGVVPAGATTITYTDVSCINSGATTCSSSVFVYYTNGTLAGVMNATGDNVVVADNESINLYLKPNSVSLLNNPSFTLNWILSSWNMFFTILLVFGLLIAMFYVIKKMFFTSGNVTPIGAPQQNNGTWKKNRWGR